MAGDILPISVAAVAARSKAGIPAPTSCPEDAAQQDLVDSGACFLFVRRFPPETASVSPSEV